MSRRSAARDGKRIAERGNGLQKDKGHQRDLLCLEMCVGTGTREKQDEVVAQSCHLLTVGNSK